ncbi:hypothetical protein GQ457_11G007370 [Hibiscus cannabinus]
MRARLGFSISFPVAVVVSVIAFVYFCTVFVFIDRWFGLMTSPGMINAFVYTGVAVMCVFNYAVAILADPGRVPSTYMPDIEDSKFNIHEIKRKDHHCVWINNCVGHANYKAFFVFVVYAVIACFYSLVLLVGGLNSDSQIDVQQRDSFRIIYVISGLLLLPLSVALSVLLGWHIYLVLQNKTTIEYHEGVRALCLAQKGGSVYKHPYDLGAHENLSSVLGPSIFSWICPTTTHIAIGDGLRFQTSISSASTRK